MGMCTSLASLIPPQLLPEALYAPGNSLQHPSLRGGLSDPELCTSWRSFVCVSCVSCHTRMENTSVVTSHRAHSRMCWAEVTFRAVTCVVAE